MEEWKSIPGYEELYQVSSFGSVRSLCQNIFGKKVFKLRLLKSPISGSGYMLVGLYKNKSRKNFLVHQLVAMAFLNHKPNGKVDLIDHKDNNPLNNKLDNLQVTTSRVNNTKDRKNKTSKYIGVSLKKDRLYTNKKWEASINIGGANFGIGYFLTEYEASLVYNKALELSHLFDGDKKLFRILVKSSI